MSGWRVLPWNTFSEIASDWDRLNQQLYQGHPLLDSRFVAALLEHFAQPHTSLVIYQTTDKSVSNILLLEPSRRLGLWQTFLPSQAQIAPVLCSEPTALSQLSAALPRFRLAIDILCQDPLYSFSKNTLTYFESFAHVTTINITIIESFTDYWQLRSHNLQKNIRRYFNRLAKNKISYQLKIAASPDELKFAMQRYGELESKSWKGAEGTAIHSDNLQGKFYTDVSQNFAKSQQIEILELYFEGKLVASRINLLNKNMFIILKTSYDENFAEYAPGRLLLYLLIEREFRLQRVKQIEFYTNATNDQISWSNGQRNIEHITVYRSAKAQWLFKILRKLKATLTKSK
jgi:hypothetical protein